MIDFYRFVTPCNSAFSPIQQARYIDVSISEFKKHAFESFLALVMFLDISFTILWKLKKAYNPFISKHNTHDLYDLYFRKGVLNTNQHSQCEGQKQH